MHIIKFYLLTIINFSVSTNMVVAPMNSLKFDDAVVKEYSAAEIAEQKNESNLYHKYYNWSLFNRYAKFIINTNQVLNLPASNLANEKFDDLYDSPSSVKVWINFNELNQYLMTTRLSNTVKLRISWNTLLKNVNVDKKNFFIYDEQLLRFYNIAVEIYGLKNVMQLVQKINLIPNLNYFAKVNFYQEILGIDFQFNRNFVNQAKINEAFEANRIATNSSIVSILHNYAQALIFFAMSSGEQRDQFNLKPIDQKIQDSKILANQKSIPAVSEYKIFNDVASSLFDYLVNAANINADDNVKKLLIPLLIVNSTNSRMAWISNNVESRDQFFTEAFCKWYGTKKSDRNFAWQLLNDYFINVFPIFYSLHYR